MCVQNLVRFQLLAVGCYVCSVDGFENPGLSAVVAGSVWSIVSMSVAYFKFSVDLHSSPARYRLEQSMAGMRRLPRIREILRCHHGNVWLDHHHFRLFVQM